MLRWLIRTKHFPDSKTLPRIQNTSQNPKHFPESKTRPRIHKHFPESKTLPRIQNHIPESKAGPRIQNTSQNLDSGKCFWILGSVLDSGKCFWILGSVLALQATVQCDCISENYLENSELNRCTVKRIWNPDFTFGYWSSCFCPMLSSGHFA